MGTDCLDVRAGGTSRLGRVQYKIAAAALAGGGPVDERDDDVTVMMPDGTGITITADGSVAMAIGDGVGLPSMEHPPGSILAAELAQESEVIHFCEDVIARLQERGWPEPCVRAEMTHVTVWGFSDGRPWVALNGKTQDIDYTTADGVETGTIYFEKEFPDVSRVVDAIDRLRWVIGLSCPEPQMQFFDRDGKDSSVVTPGGWFKPIPDFKAVGFSADWSRLCGVDPDGPLVAMKPSKADSAQERPYEPTRWIEDTSEP